jgi:hypothetical protein
MKATKEHRVPLPNQRFEFSAPQPHLKDNELVFPSARGKQLSDMSMTAVMRRMEVDAVPHGFRSTFRDWARERTNYPRDLAEQALAHALDNKVEAAYRRGDALEKRRLMMQEWDDFCSDVRRKKKKPEGRLPAAFLSIFTPYLAIKVDTFDTELHALSNNRDPDGIFQESRACRRLTYNFPSMIPSIFGISPGSSPSPSARACEKPKTMLGSRRNS